tara:strand:+ start:10886 stop:12934 length:2049 start_codon:yes stop_codon:yes gene_type:complete
MSGSSGERALADRNFVSRLGGNRAGRVLQAHLACIALREEGQARDSSIQEAVLNERVLITAIAQSLALGRPMPCGLPTPLPKFVVVCNLSGERLVLYSNSRSIVRKLCSRSSVITPREVAHHVALFENFPFAEPFNDEHHFVLLSFSLPWQAGVGSTFWTMSMCTHSKTTKRLWDRQMTFTSHTTAPFKGKPILDPGDSGVALKDGRVMPLVTPRQLDDLKESFWCSCVDFDGDGGDDDDDDDKKDERVEERKASAAPAAPAAVKQLKSVIQTLKIAHDTDRAEIKELRAQKAAFEARLKALADERDAQVRKDQKEFAQTIEEREAVFKTAEGKFEELKTLYSADQLALREELKSWETKAKQSATDYAQLSREKKTLAARFEEAKRQANSKDKLANAATSKYKLITKQGEDALLAAKAELETIRSTLAREHQRATNEQAEKHAKEMERLKTALSGKTRIINQLSEVSERREEEIHSLQAVDSLKAVAIAELEVEVATLKTKLEKLAQRERERSRERATPRSKNAATSTTNSSTNTHSCQSTQTVPLPRPPATPPQPKPKRDVFADANATHATTTAETCDANAPVAQPTDNFQNWNRLRSETLVHNAMATMQSLVSHVFVLENQISAMSHCHNVQFQYLLHPQHQLVHPNLQASTRSHQKTTTTQQQFPQQGVVYGNSALHRG